MGFVHLLQEVSAPIVKIFKLQIVGDIYEKFKTEILANLLIAELIS